MIEVAKEAPIEVMREALTEVTKEVTKEAVIGVAKEPMIGVTKEVMKEPTNEPMIEVVRGKNGGTGETGTSGQERNYFMRLSRHLLCSEYIFMITIHIPQVHQHGLAILND